jgi:adhesin transport system membrane fusion protein
MANTQPNPAPHPHAAHAEPAMPLLDRESRLPALAMAGSARVARILAWSLTILFGILLVFLIFMPWQQFVSGYGRVVALDPMDRVVTLEAPLAGRVQKAHILEGQSVEAGDLLFELVDNDPNLQANLRQQKADIVARRDSLKARLDSIGAQLVQQEASYLLAVAAAKQRLEAARAASITATRQYDRIKALFQDRRGLASERDYELATLERDRTDAELFRAEAELRRADADGQAAVAAVGASRSSAEADLAAANQAIVSIDVQLNQFAQQRVTAPRAGIILRLHATEGSFLRAGSPLCTLVPHAADRLVELWLDGNDLPLLTPGSGVTAFPRGEYPGKNSIRPYLPTGSQVRLQFEGWPAIQIIGWPSLARGTFGGEILSIDPTDNGKGQFRVLIGPRPDPIIRQGQTIDKVDWPDARWLRQGVRVHGWVLLNRVPLWFEIWRQINGFPPMLEPQAFSRLHTVDAPADAGSSRSTPRR